jgi:hypothetical protein
MEGHLLVNLHPPSHPATPQPSPVSCPQFRNPNPILQQVFFAIALSAQGVAQGTAMAPDVGKAKAAVQSIFAVLDHKPAVDADDVSGTKVERLDGSIAFRCALTIACVRRPAL